MDYIVINPKDVASKLAHKKVVADLVDPNGKSAVLKEKDLLKNDGTYKTWVQGIYMEEFEQFEQLLKNSHNEKLLRKAFGN